MASRKRYRYTFEIVFSSEEEKTGFSERVERVRRKLEGSAGGKKLNNMDLLSHLLGIVETDVSTDEAVVVPQENRSGRLMNMNSAILDVQCRLYTYTMMSIVCISNVNRP